MPQSAWRGPGARPAGLPCPTRRCPARPARWDGGSGGLSPRDTPPRHGMTPTPHLPMHVLCEMPWWSMGCAGWRTLWVISNWCVAWATGHTPKSCWPGPAMVGPRSPSKSWTSGTSYGEKGLNRDVGPCLGRRALPACTGKPYHQLPARLPLGPPATPHGTATRARMPAANPPPPPGTAWWIT